MVPARVRNRLYGPVSVDGSKERPDSVHVAPSVVTITAIEEVLTAMSRRAETSVADARKLGETGRVIKTMTSGESTWRHHNLADLTDPDFDAVAFMVAFTTAPTDELAAAKYSEHLFISRDHANFSASRKGPGRVPEVDMLRLREMAATLTRDERRLMPRKFRTQLSAAALASGVAGLWLWTMLDAGPPLPVWLLSGLLVAALCWTAKERLEHMPSPSGPDRPIEGVVVDRTPRREVEAIRYNHHLNRRVAILTSIIAGPLGIIVGAVGTKLLGL